MSSAVHQVAPAPSTSTSLPMPPEPPEVRAERTVDAAVNALLSDMRKVYFSFTFAASSTHQVITLVWRSYVEM